MAGNLIYFCLPCVHDVKKKKQQYHLTSCCLVFNYQAPQPIR